MMNWMMLMPAYDEKIPETLDDNLLSMEVSYD